MPHEVRLKLKASEYLYLQGLARFYYDNCAIATSAVHSLGKLAIRRIANEWIHVQTMAAKKKTERKSWSLSLRMIVFGLYQ